MTLHNSASIPPLVDFELSYIEKGKRVKVYGKAKAKLDAHMEYEDYYDDSYSSPIATFRTSHSAKINLDLVMDEGKLYTMRITEEAKPMEKVKKTITVDVPDKTFNSVATARKKAGAPKTATFEFDSKTTQDALYSKLNVVTFTWEDTL